MTQRLPSVNGDDGTWGGILNGFLGVAHNSDGTLSTSAVSSSGAEMTSNKGAASGYAPLDGSSLLPYANIPVGTAGSASKVLAANDASTTNSRTPSGTASGDLSGSYPGPTVAKINGVAITAAQATLLSQINNATTRSATATLNAGEETVFTGSTASQTLTLPGSTAQNSSVNVIVNLASVSVTLAPGSGTTLNTYGTVGSLTVLTGQAYQVVLVGMVWYVIGSSTPTADVTLDQFGAPVNPVSMGSQLIHLLAAGVSATDAANVGQLKAQPGAELARTYYAPATPASKTTSSTVGVAVDTTNLTVTFTASTTAVEVELTGMVGFFANVGSIFWGLFTHGTSTQVGTWAAVSQWSSTSQAMSVSTKIVVTGLTVGTAYQYDWAFGTTAGTILMGFGGVSGGTLVAGNFGPATMRVLAG